MVAGVAIIAVIQCHLTGADPGLAIGYALGVTSKLSGSASGFTEIERELVAVERCGLYTLTREKGSSSRGALTVRGSSLLCSRWL